MVVTIPRQPFRPQRQQRTLASMTGRLPRTPRRPPDRYHPAHDDRAAHNPDRPRDRVPFSIGDRAQHQIDANTSKRNPREHRPRPRSFHGLTATGTKVRSPAPGAGPACGRRACLPAPPTDDHSQQCLLGLGFLVVVPFVRIAAATAHKHRGSREHRWRKQRKPQPRRHTPSLPRFPAATHGRQG